MLTVQRTKWKGKSLRRKEDLRFLTGRGWYTGDIKLPNLAYAAFVRSPYPHARIVNVKKAKAEALPHVMEVITGKEIAAEVNSLPNLLASPHNQQKDFGIAVDKVRYAGEPVALVVAEDKYAAADAVDEVEVDYEQLAPILSPQKALENDCSLVHENPPSNAMWHRKFTYGDVDGAFGSADLTVKKSFHFHRFTSAPRGFACDHAISYGVNISGLEYSQLARLFGGYGERVEDPEHLEGAVARVLGAVREGKLGLLDVVLSS